MGKKEIEEDSQFKLSMWSVTLNKPFWNAVKRRPTSWSPIEGWIHHWQSQLCLWAFLWFGWDSLLKNILCLKVGEYELHCGSFSFNSSFGFGTKSTSIWVSSTTPLLVSIVLISTLSWAPMAWTPLTCDRQRLSGPHQYYHSGLALVKQAISSLLFVLLSLAFLDEGQVQGKKPNTVYILFSRDLLVNLAMKLLTLAKGTICLIVCWLTMIAKTTTRPGLIRYNVKSSVLCHFFQSIISL